MSDGNDQAEQSKSSDSYNILFAVKRSSRYHAARRDFFESLELLTNFPYLLLGSAAVYMLLLEQLGQENILWFTAGVAVISVLKQVFRIEQYVKQHVELYKRFMDLERMIVAVEEPTDSDIKVWQKERLEIEKDEPGTKEVLNCLMHNKVVRSDGYPSDYLLEIKWYQGIFAQFFDIFPDKIKPIRDKPPLQHEQKTLSSEVQDDLSN